VTDRPILVLFRRDLRIGDNGALAAAQDSGRPVLPVFILDEESDGSRPLGGASRWWLHHSLQALSQALDHLGAPFVLRRGLTLRVVADLVRQSGAQAVYWNRRYDPAGVAADTALKAALHDAEIEAKSFDGHLLHEPSRVKTGQGGPYKVYSAFWRALSDGPEPRDPIDAPKHLHAFAGDITSLVLEDLGLLPAHPDWAGGLRDSWTPGEAGAHERLDDFLSGGIKGYGELRDRPDREATSRLSPHLAFGEITPFTIFAALRDARLNENEDSAKFRKEVVWREFCHHLLFHNPNLAVANYQPSFDAFGWRSDPAALAAWQRGRTGYPIVDAGMRELWHTGSMHNRVRMITASFLTKHLLIDWRDGERWFWDTLVDADPASNPANWQWVAGSGADAAPYFRIFNPVLQGEKFDPNGDYVRRWVPEIAGLPDKFLHKPWASPATVLEKAGLKPGKTYPLPVVDHDAARERALATYRATRAVA
jgi:deoxyribodipyrimidine photo-lyase